MIRRSFFRWVIRVVLVAWLLSFGAVVLWATTRSWIEERAQSDGVFLVHAMLDEVPAPARAARLAELAPHFSVGLSLVERGDVEQEVGRVVAAGDVVPHRVSAREEWMYLVFADGAGALAAGPEHPAVPHGAVPFAALLGLLAVPTVAGVLALRVERELAQVEKVSRAIAVGEFSARVAPHDGPTNELAATFNAMAERIEGLMRSRDELVQAVSHELGSPLSRLRFQLELLEGEATEDGTSRIASMGRDLDALDELVGELLGYVQTDGLVPNRQTFDPARVLTDLAELAALDAQNGREIDVSVQLGDRVLVLADPRLFQRAVENLLRNAMRHASQRVRLELTAESDAVRVAVHDDGPGIDEALREQVTQPFFRAEADRGRHTGGVGLGLAIVARILDGHTGRIEITDSPLGGAQVTTVWPSDGVGERASRT